MKTKIAIFIGISILFLFGNALAEIFLQVNASGGVFNPGKDRAGVFPEAVEQRFHLGSLIKNAGMQSSSYFNNLLNEDRVKKTTDWFFELIASEEMKTSISSEGKSTKTPVPPAIYLLGTGLVGLAGFRGRQRKK